MGILRKAALGTVLAGLGALAVKNNPKPVNRFRKAVSKTLDTALRDGKAVSRMAAREAKSTVRKAKTSARKVQAASKKAYKHSMNMKRS